MIVLAALIFLGLTWWRFHVGLFLFFLLLPTYLWRLMVGPIPTTFLELMLVILFSVWVFKERNRTQKRKKGKGKRVQLKHTDPLLYYGILLFLVGATVGMFVSQDLRAAAGEWKAFYVEPVIFFFLLVRLNSNRVSGSVTNLIIFALILSGLVTSLLAIYQHFTGWMVPEAFWLSGRVTAWYGFPNAVGLFLAPLMPLALLSIGRTIRGTQKHSNTLRRHDIIGYLSISVSLLFLIAGPLAIIFAKSTGALVGLTAGLGLVLLWNKNTRVPTLVVGGIAMILLLTIPQTTSLRAELFANDRSGNIRKAIWSETITLLKDHPLIGAGLASYTEKIIPYHGHVSGEGIEIFHHPHSIFLTMYVNTGLVGFVGFILMIAWFYRTGIRALKQHPEHDWALTLLISAMTILLVHGLVDSPYIKNDLSILFWTLLALQFLWVKYPQKKP
jgi:O-antigen ligase